MFFHIFVLAVGYLDSKSQGKIGYLKCIIVRLATTHMMVGFIMMRCQ